MARHRAVVLLSWSVILLVCAALSPALKQELSGPDYGVDGSQSSRVEQLLESPSFRGAGGEQDVIAFYSPKHSVDQRAYRASVARVLRAARSQPGVERVSNPYGARGSLAHISADKHVAAALVTLGGNARERFERIAHLQSVIAAASGAGAQAWLTGFSPLASDLAQVESADGERAEAIGMPVALVALILALGALTAAIVPLLLAGAGLLLTFGLIYVLAAILKFDAFLVTVVTMIGVGIGIDYTLFIVSRFREELARLPADPRRERRRASHAVGLALATSGRTIIYSGTIVALSLMSLLVIRAPIFQEFVIGILSSVVCTLTAALTLLPAVLAQLGPRINAGSLPERLQPADAKASASEGQGGWRRWALAVMRRPMIVAVAVSLPLVVAMVPMLGLRYGIDIGLPALSGTPSGRGAQVLARSFGPGIIGPLTVVVTDPPTTGGHQRLDRVGAEGKARGKRSSAALTGVRTLESELRGDHSVGGMTDRSYTGGVLLSVMPTVPVDSSADYALVQRIRGDLAPSLLAREGVVVLVGGAVAQAVDVSNVTSAKLPLVVVLTLGIALIFLLVMLRSVVLPIKAVAMNVLATGATLGLVVLIFQDGHGEGLIGFSSPGFIQSFLPLCIFVLLFGLSMDYEVFLIRRMQETWRKTGNNRLAVASGVEHTARPISAAAAIMVAVFGSFVTANVLELKEFGFALALAIALDATLIRLLLVPALMSLFGARNWWLPRGLGRVLPRFELD
ncbi:MAG TPA: MMPL family transporter [Solirubrobacteraceae bacterium]|jgi:RND superfamily putative drug exporter|nr:MMPL family transporter [Solirubrobacteraceae bacterium]